MDLGAALNGDTGRTRNTPAHDALFLSRMIFRMEDRASTRSHRGSRILSLPIRLRQFSAALLLILGFFLISITGCGTLENGRGWGQDAIYPVDSKRISHSLYNACTDWGTLIPAGGAVVSSFDDFDHRASEWATAHTPIFGSQDSASLASNYLLYALEGEVLLTALATPSGEDPKQWTDSKAKGLSVEVGAELVTAGVTGGLKTATNRTRPSGGSDSFPSGHSSAAFSSATLANRNLDSIPMSKNLRFVLQAGNLLLATATAWARVEASAHFPADVLAGAALGHFFSASIYDGFMGVPELKPYRINVLPEGGGGVVTVSFSF
jgi:PAP2 superfamily